MKNEVHLVTGSCGFLGYHLSKNLLASGHSVIGIDNFYSGTKYNRLLLEKESAFELVEGDINDPAVFHRLDGREIKYIWNLACPASPPRYQADPVFTMKTSIYGVINGLEAAKKWGATFFQASTSEIYGDPLEHPQTEDYRGNVNTIGIRACYDEGKRAAESLVFDYHRTHKVPVKLVRIFNTYGPNMDPGDGRVVSNFIVQALNHAPLTMYGTGEQTRSFCYVDDLITGFIKLMEAPGEVTGPVNLGNPGEFTILELAKMVLRLLPDSKSQLDYMPLPKDDPTQRQPNISRAKEWLKWEPQVQLEQGLLPTIEYFKKVKEL